MYIEESIKINASSESIFSYLLNVDNRKDYFPALEEVIMLDPLPLRTGSRYIEVAMIAGRKLSTTYQITDFVLNKKLSAKTIKSVFPIKVDLIITELPNACSLSIQMEFKLSGIFRFASAIVQGIVRVQARGILDKLNANLE